MKENKEKKEKKPINWKPFAIIVVVLGIIAGCIYFVSYKGGKVTAVTITSEAQRQYENVNLEDFMAEYSGVKGTKPLSEYNGNITLSVSCYYSDSFTLYIDEQMFVVKCPNYVEANDVEWTYKGYRTLPASIQGIAENPQDFMCRIEYADGYVGEGTAEYVEVDWSGNTATATIYASGKTFTKRFSCNSERDYTNAQDVTSDDFISSNTQTEGGAFEPTIIDEDGEKRYYINGEYITYDEWLATLSPAEYMQWINMFSDPEKEGIEGPISEPIQTPEELSNDEVTGDGDTTEEPTEGTTEE